MRTFALVGLVCVFATVVSACEEVESAIGVLQYEGAISRCWSLVCPGGEVHLSGGKLSYSTEVTIDGHKYGWLDAVDGLEFGERVNVTVSTSWWGNIDFRLAYACHVPNTTVDEPAPAVPPSMKCEDLGWSSAAVTSVDAEEKCWEVQCDGTLHFLRIAVDFDDAEKALYIQGRRFSGYGVWQNVSFSGPVSVRYISSPIGSKNAFSFSYKCLSGLQGADTPEDHDDPVTPMPLVSTDGTAPVTVVLSIQASLSLSTLARARLLFLENALTAVLGAKTVSARSLCLGDACYNISSQPLATDQFRSASTRSTTLVWALTLEVDVDTPAHLLPDLVLASKTAVENSLSLPNVRLISVEVPGIISRVSADLPAPVSTQQPTTAPSPLEPPSVPIPESTFIPVVIKLNASLPITFLTRVRLLFLEEAVRQVLEARSAVTLTVCVENRCYDAGGRRLREKERSGSLLETQEWVFTLDVDTDVPPHLISGRLLASKVAIENSLSLPSSALVSADTARGAEDVPDSGDSHSIFSPPKGVAIPIIVLLSVTCCVAVAVGLYLIKKHLLSTASKSEGENQPYGEAPEPYGHKTEKSDSNPPTQRPDC